jgi:membrane protease YdiL (CAAX protease family)
MEPNNRVPHRVLYETIFILVLTFAAQFLWKDFAIIFALVPTIYFFTERSIRRRTWADVGFKIRTIPQDIVSNWFFILLVSVITQFFVVWIAKTWMPAFLDHVIARLPLTFSQTMAYLPVILVGALWEEINYRAFYQERLSWFIPAPVAIGLVSIMFGIGHWATGNPVIVMIDILLVIVDSVFYGVIFARSKNILIAWIAHFLANLFAMGFYLLL